MARWRRKGSNWIPRTRSQRSAAERHSFEAADAAVRNLTLKVSDLVERLEMAEKVLDAFVGDTNLSDRLLALLLALRGLASGQEPSWLDRLRRNAALHAAAPELDGEHLICWRGAASVRPAWAEARRRAPPRGWF